MDDLRLSLELLLNALLSNNRSLENQLRSIGDFVQANSNGTDTTIRIDQTGTGNFAAGVDVVTLAGVATTDPDVLKSQGNLVV